MHFSTFFKYCPVCGSNMFHNRDVKSKHCNACGFVYFVNPSAAVAAFIRNEKGELLVCRRANEPAAGTLDLPGGFVDAGETGEIAIAREIKEELNASTNSIHYLFSLPNDYLYSGLTVPTLDLFFECALENYETIQPADDVSECFFAPIKDLNSDEFGLLSIKKAIDIYSKSFSVK